MSGSLPFPKGLKAGDPIRPGMDPMTAVDPPPPLPEFSPDSVEFVINPATGLPVIVAGGRCPNPGALIGSVLVAASKGRAIKFGALHPKVRDGDDAPFRLLFELPDLPGSAHGILEAARHVDVLFVRPSGEPVPFVFLFMRWDALMSPGRRGETGADGGRGESPPPAGPAPAAGAPGGPTHG